VTHIISATAWSQLRHPFLTGAKAQLCAPKKSILHLRSIISTMHYVSAEQALQIIQSDQHVFVHGSACTPVFLHAQTTWQNKPIALRNVELVSISLYGDVTVDKPHFSPQFSFQFLVCFGQYPAGCK
jgi:hypothetical protein